MCRGRRVVNVKQRCFRSTRALADAYGPRERLVMVCGRWIRTALVHVRTIWPLRTHACADVGLTDGDWELLRGTTWAADVELTVQAHMHRQSGCTVAFSPGGPADGPLRSQSESFFSCLES